MGSSVGITGLIERPHKFVSNYRCIFRLGFYSQWVVIEKLVIGRGGFFLSSNEKIQIPGMLNPMGFLPKSLESQFRKISGIFKNPKKSRNSKTNDFGIFSKKIPIWDFRELRDFLGAEKSQIIRCSRRCSFSRNYSCNLSPNLGPIRSLFLNQDSFPIIQQCHVTWSYEVKVKNSLSAIQKCYQSVPIAVFSKLWSHDLEVNCWPNLTSIITKT